MERTRHTKIFETNRAVLVNNTALIHSQRPAFDILLLLFENLEAGRFL